MDGQKVVFKGEGFRLPSAAAGNTPELTGVLELFVSVGGGGEEGVAAKNNEGSSWSRLLKSLTCSGMFTAHSSPV